MKYAIVLSSIVSILLLIGIASGIPNKQKVQNTFDTNPFPLFCNTTTSAFLRGFVELINDGIGSGYNYEVSRLHGNITLNDEVSSIQMVPWRPLMNHYCSFYGCARETWSMAFDIKIRGEEYVGDVMWELWKDIPERSHSTLFIETLNMSCIAFIYGPLPTFVQLGPS